MTDDYVPTPDISRDTGNMVKMWAMCCFSPILYLGASWYLRPYVPMEAMPRLSPDLLTRVLVIMGLVCLVIQGIHLAVRLKSRARLAAVAGDPPLYAKRLLARTLTLIGLSELPVFSGLCLFLLQGDLRIVFGFGLFSMLLYGQSHPRSFNPLFPSRR